MIEDYVISFVRIFYAEILSKLRFTRFIEQIPLPNFCFNNILAGVVENEQIHPATPGLDLKIHITADEANELVEIGEKEILSDILVGCVWDLQYSEACPGDKILEVVQEQLHVNVSIGR